MSIHNNGTFTFLATTDISARTKGRAISTKDFEKGASVGWVPANLGIGPLGHIVDGIPYDATGDIRLVADADATYEIAGIPEIPTFSLSFANLINTDGTPWESCARNFLKEAVDELRDRHGLVMTAAFEHEFTERHAKEATHPFSFASFVDGEPVGSALFNVLENAGVNPECWLPEYAPYQYELTVKPTDPVTAADRAILVRDIVRTVFKAYDREVTFSPVPVASEGGSGVHVHYGLYGTDGEVVAFDPDGPGRMSRIASQFNAGLVKYAAPMTCLFAPLTVSYERLKPHNWSVAQAFCGEQNREALVRICPTNEADGRTPDKQFHFEFRGGDIGANPWILMGMIIRAGMAGIEENLDPVPVVTGDDYSELESQDNENLPASLKEALDRFETNEVVRSWFSDAWVETFLKVKRDEIQHLKDKSIVEQCEVYANVY
ncbi:glutamine synthetase [Corynebacterium coyleae]|uniref:Glutamine synthetase family protein n=1 Tax=Corynebacterium coyleae TaxID=53374 RepID=A0ABX8KXI4_9CORY|nr:MULTISPECIES: glutamine synthetase family protein [Corynebacterium]OFL91734.1 glutamine synthetase [Corynebacterium sp. HMSC055D05]OHO32528.1 glutamine synthetase [Corynebacterium sp. HMSC034E11]OHO33138.1 glutamine synthetase [Corynebacterium sp. HMSC034B08]OHO78073.1 glutamine synthetase [Corynebacterium sp. HMSC036E10]QXB19505.1 glutamine synthetase family protein [Corynebacterium coyleae]